LISGARRALLRPGIIGDQFGAQSGSHNGGDGKGVVCPAGGGDYPWDGVHLLEGDGQASGLEFG
jgi:hypothetical protein